MSNLKAVEAEVENLSLRRLAEFRAWFLNYDADLSDKEVEADYRSENWTRSYQRLSRITNKARPPS